MMGLLRTMRRAPARLLASVVAIALAVGAIGVFAVPGVAAGTLRDLAADDRLAHVAVDVTGDVDVADLDLPGVDAFELRDVGIVDTADHDQLRIVGVSAEDQQINLLRPVEGRLPGAGEAVVSDGVAAIGDTVAVNGVDLAVVGVGTTAWWSFSDTVYTAPETASTLVGGDSTRLLLRHADPTEDNLDATVAALRAQLGPAAFADFPEVVPDGTHPIEEDLVQISTMIGLLGVVAGIVALTLLATTSSTLITERTREVAVMRALGSRRRPLRRRLRRLALGVAAAGLIVGIPLGLVVANLVARMVLERFVGVTPDIGWSPVVAGASAVFAIGGAWLVSGRAARRVTKLPLAEALRDRMGDAWGRRLGDRLASRLRLGGLFERLAIRNTLRRRARSASTVVQVAAGVGSVIVVASLATSVTAFNGAELEPWQWETRSIAHAPGLPMELDEADALGEPAIRVWGEVGDWDVEVHGLDPATAMIDRTVEAGRWLDVGPGVVVSQGFADHQGLTTGDRIGVELATGTVDYEIVGLHRSRARDVYVGRDVLAADLGRSGFVNAVYSAADTPPDLGLAADTSSVAEMSAEDQAARDAIVGIFMAIGGIVAGVTVLGVMSLVAVSLHERRHETATLVAIGGRRADVRRSLVTELLPLGALGAALGVVAGWGGAVGIIAGFEASSAVDIGTDFAEGAVGPAVAGGLAVLVLVALAAARQATRVPAAVVLRGSA
ncbi:MAG: ABC transporter permease [Actinomycetota bacterium]